MNHLPDHDPGASGAAERIRNDFYPTDPRLAHLLIPFRRFIGGRVLEPCAGSGTLAAGIRRALPVHVTTGDLDPRWTTDVGQIDACDPDALAAHRPDWIITNPPFSEMNRILKAAWEATGTGLALLLRLSGLEPTAGRDATLKALADHQIGLVPISGPRPRFRRRGTDSVTVAWFIWSKEWSWREMGILTPFQFVTGWKYFK